jgi:hypothetical protein
MRNLESPKAESISNTRTSFLVLNRTHYHVSQGWAWRRIVLPPVLVIERVCAEVFTRAQRQVHRALTEWLTDEQRRKFDQLLESRDGGSHSLLAWLRLPPGAPSARNILSHIERLQEIRTIGIPVKLLKKFTKTGCYA